MKIEVNVGKKHLIVFLIFVFVIISGIFVYAGVSGVSHVWDEITGKPNLENCVGSNQALKTINLQTGAVTCEADDAGGMISESDPTVSANVKDGVSWGEVSSKPAELGKPIITNCIGGYKSSPCGAHDICFITGFDYGLDCKLSLDRNGWSLRHTKYIHYDQLERSCYASCLDW